MLFEGSGAGNSPRRKDRVFEFEERAGDEGATCSQRKHKRTLSALNEEQANRPAQSGAEDPGLAVPKQTRSTSITNISSQRPSVAAVEPQTQRKSLAQVSYPLRDKSAHGLSNDTPLFKNSRPSEQTVLRTLTSNDLFQPTQQPDRAKQPALQPQQKTLQAQYALQTQQQAQLAHLALQAQHAQQAQLALMQMHLQQLTPDDRQLPPPPQNEPRAANGRPHPRAALDPRGSEQKPTQLAQEPLNPQSTPDARTGHSDARTGHSEARTGHSEARTGHSEART